MCSLSIKTVNIRNCAQTTLKTSLKEVAFSGLIVTEKHTICGRLKNDVEHLRSHPVIFKSKYKALLANLRKKSRDYFRNVTLM